MNLAIEIEQEEDGCFLAEAIAFRGVLMSESAKSTAGG